MNRMYRCDTAEGFKLHQPILVIAEDWQEGRGKVVSQLRRLGWAEHVHESEVVEVESRNIHRDYGLDNIAMSLEGY